MSRQERHEFVARVYRVGILRCVDVPREVGASLSEWRHPPVRLRVGGREGQSHLVPAGSGRFRLFLDDALRAAAGVDDGDSVAIELRLDPSIDAERFPDDLLDVAAAVPGGLVVLETLPPGLKGEVLRFLSGAKQASTRRKRLARIEQLLRERAAKQAMDGLEPD